MKLASSSHRTQDGRRYALVEYDGVSFRVFDDAGTALRIVELIGDESITAATKVRIAGELLFADPDGAKEAASDYAGLCVKAIAQVIGTPEKGKRVLDWDEDADRIKASLWMVYGLGFEQLKGEVDFPELCSMIGLCPHDTPIGQAIYYRTAEEPKRTKGNEEAVKRFNELREYYALGKKDTGQDPFAQNGALVDAFNALKRKAKVKNG